MQFKVCGITSIEAANAIANAGANYIGFIFYPSSKRYALTSLSLNDIAVFKPANAQKVGVFVNETTEKVIEIATKAGLDMIQLHGDEDASYCATIQAAFPVIKVFRVSKNVPDFALFENVAAYYLFDTDSALYGGTGQHFNWEIIKKTSFNKPFFLSGGIGINDVQGIQVLKAATAGKDLVALDMNSKFETSPGIKNIELIKTFIDEFI
jgi:phosphoribosylanthranilate isomerase